MVTVSDVLNKARYLLDKGCAEGSKNHLELLNTYNTHRPLARNYKVKPTDHWCMTFVSTVFIMLDATSLIGGTECSCQNEIGKMKKIGIWIEDGSIKPIPGDIIFYDWDHKGSAKTNNGWSDHVGIVESVKGEVITVIEGNYQNSIKRRRINVGWGYIRGYARPKYDKTIDTVEHNSPKKSVTEVAEEVIQGIWGTGINRINSLRKAGYNSTEVQNEVNRLLTKKKPVTDVAKEVIDGKWGNNPQRSQALIKAGYNPSEVQKEVNKLLR